ncbi:MAG: DUF2339 domain-containing protein, partial [Pseudomonadota bacterium]
SLLFNSRHGETAVLNGTFLGSVLIALAGLFSAYYLFSRQERLRSWEQRLHIAPLVWGLGWWTLAGASEIERFVPWEHQVNALLLFIALSSAALLWLWRRLAWDVLQYPLMLLLPAAALLSVNVLDSGGHFFADWGLLPWLALFAVQYRILWRLEVHYSEPQLRFGHSATLWLLLWVLSWEVHWWVGEWLEGRGVWAFAAWGLVPGAVMALLLGPVDRLRWPLGRWLATYRGEALLPVVLVSAVWFLFAVGNSGDPWPLPYLPLLNPLELSQLFMLLVVMMWGWYNRNDARLLGYGITLRGVGAGVGVAAFLLLNGVVAHAVHHWGGVAYRAEALFGSMVFQASISILWTLYALGLAAVATRRGWRTVWFAGAVLLGAVVVKLFVVDLSRSDTMERIVSFIVVGLLMLLIGYLSPLPPKQSQEENG